MHALHAWRIRPCSGVITLTGNTAPFEEMSQRGRAVGNTVSDLNLRPPTPETKALLLDICYTTMHGGIDLRVFALGLKRHSSQVFYS